MAIINNAGTYTTTIKPVGNTLENELSTQMRLEIDRRILLAIKLNMGDITDEEIIREILKDKDIYHMIINPSDTVKEAYKFKYEL